MLRIIALFLIAICTFAADDPAAGVQLGFISRTGHRVSVGTANVLAMFESLT